MTRFGTIIDLSMKSPVAASLSKLDRVELKGARMTDRVETFFKSEFWVVDSICSANGSVGSCKLS